MNAEEFYEMYNEKVRGVRGIKRELMEAFEWGRNCGLLEASEAAYALTKISSMEAEK